MSSNRLEIAMLALVAIGSLFVPTQEAEAGYRRQYYASWSYYPRTNYYYTRYYYQPTSYVSTPSYNYHYVICYPSQPRYRYYYNPVRRRYWGRFEVDKSGKPIGYSMLKPKDQKSSLEDIPESAFPKPSKMPPIPESKDGKLMAPPPKFDADKAKNTPPEKGAVQKKADEQVEAKADDE